MKYLIISHFMQKVFLKNVINLLFNYKIQEKNLT